MLLAWLLYATVCSAVVAMGGLAAERTLQLFALPQRWAWTGAIVASLAVPVVLPRVRTLGTQEAPAIVAAVAGLPAAQPGASAVTVPPGADAAALGERVALAGWLLASGVLAGWLALSALSLRRARKQWCRRVVEGTPVLVSRDTGPAVVGWLRAEVVLPAWVLEWDESRRRMVVAHEREHVRARDPLLLMGGWLSVALAPWSLPLWWQVHRLRLAVEVDCDRRVLRDADDIRAYGTLLLEVGRRTERGWIPSAAFSEPRRTLERRLRMITWKRPRNRGRHAVAAIAATAMVPAALFALPPVETPPLEPLAALLASRVAAQEPAVLWITAGDEFRIGRPDAPVVREDQLEDALAALRTGDAGTGTLIVRSDSARVAAPGMGYSAIMAGNAACRAGFATVAYELVKQVPGSAERRRVGVSERRLAPPCDGTGPADTLAAVRPAGAPAPGGSAVDRPDTSPAGVAVVTDTIPDDRVFVELGRLDRRPAVANAREVTALMARIYPEALRDQGIGGQVVTRFDVGVDGTVDPATIHINAATDSRLVEATREVVGQLRFLPGELAGEAVRTRVHVPVTWTPAVASTALPAATPASDVRQAPRLRVRGYNVPAVRPAMADSARGYPREAASAASAPRDSDRTTGQITGTVRSAGGAPIPGVAVSIPAVDVGAITDAAGRFTLQRVPAGTHDIFATRVGYLASTERATVLAGESTTLDFTLAVAAVELQGVVAIGYGAVRRGDVEAATPAPQATIVGLVLDANARPVVGASVVIPALSIGAVSTEQGTFVLRVPVGAHEVHVLAPGSSQAVVRAVSVPRTSEPVPLEVAIPPR